MRKLKLQMQVSVDGFVAGANGEMDWMVWNWDDALKEQVNEITGPVDCILLGRNLAEGFIPSWRSRTENPDTADDFARKMVETPKIVFTRTLKSPAPWENTELASGELADEINRLKASAGNDIIVYGGASFVTSLMKENLIDEYNLFVNPVALGKGRAIFAGLESRLNLTLTMARAFDCGIVLLRYQARR